MENINEPILTIRPKFSAIMFFLNKYFATLIAIIFLMVITIKANLTIYFIVFIAIYLGYIVIKLITNNRKYNNIAYLFYNDKIIVLNRNRRGEDFVVTYDSIVDILMYQNYMQKFTDIGDLVVKLDDRKFMGKTLSLISIGEYKNTVKEIYNVIYNNEEE